MTSEELGSYLRGSQNTTLKRWVIIEPLSKKEFNLHQRVIDLITRMIAAKINGADCIFHPDPFDPETGLMNPDGTPGELFLPWRTLALELSGTHYLGKLHLPHESNNLLFSRGQDAAMVVWNERSAIETLYLGDEVRQIDLWGRRKTPPPRRKSTNHLRFTPADDYNGRK